MEKEMATHSGILAWRILWTEEPRGLLSVGSQRVGHDWSDLACMHALEKEMATHSSVLAWRIPETEESGGLPSMGLHRVGHDWSDLAAAADITKAYFSKAKYARSWEYNFKNRKFWWIGVWFSYHYFSLFLPITGNIC